VELTRNHAAGAGALDRPRPETRQTPRAGDYQDRYDTLRRRLRHRQSNRILETARRRQRFRLALYGLCTLTLGFTLYLVLN
jgi:hypothetical protein